MNDVLRTKLSEAREVARQALDVLDTLPPKALNERAAEFCEDAFKIRDYATRAESAGGDELAEIMFCLGGLCGSLQYQVYELTDQREDRRKRNRRIADLRRYYHMAERFEELGQSHRRTEVIALLAEEFQLSERRVEQRLAAQLSPEQMAELEGFKSLPWFTEYARRAERSLCEPE